MREAPWAPITINEYLCVRIMQLLLLGTCNWEGQGNILLLGRGLLMIVQIVLTPLFLFLYFPASRTAAIGTPVSRFLRPFESRPADPIRRVYYAHLAAQPGQSIHGAAWVAPQEVPSQPPLSLPPPHELQAQGSIAPWKKAGRARKNGPKK